MIETPMVFTVRKGLIVHRQVTVERFDGRRTISAKSLQSHVGGTDTATVELTAVELRLHAHAVEATDDRSADALAALHYVPPAPSQEAVRVRANAELEAQDRIVAGVTRALIGAGIIKAAKAVSA